MSQSLPDSVAHALPGRPNSEDIDAVVASVLDHQLDGGPSANGVRVGEHDWWLSITRADGPTVYGRLWRRTAETEEWLEYADVTIPLGIALIVRVAPSSTRPPQAQS